jgi:hypothetical protein
MHNSHILGGLSDFVDLFLEVQNGNRIHVGL